MKPSHSFNRSRLPMRQRGDFLIESLIGVLLIGIVGVGIATTASKVTRTQIATQEQAQIISKLEGIASGGLESEICGDADSLGITAGEFSQDLKYNKSKTCGGGSTIEQINIEIGGTTIMTKKPVVMIVDRDNGDEGAVLQVGQYIEAEN